jgi:RNA polymerase sigma-70 factor (ECF subfamily)
LKNISVRPRRHSYGPQSCKQQQKYMSDIINSHNLGDAITNSEEQERKLADFELQVGPHFPVIRRACISKTGNQVQGEDLAQVVILKAFKYWDTYTDQGKGPMNWINTIIRTSFISSGMAESKHQKNRVNIKADDNDFQDEWIFDKADLSQLGPSAEHVVISKMETNEIMDTINQIDPIFREVALLNLVDGLKYREIADLLDIPEATVGTRVLRARGLLRSLLLDKAAEYGINTDSKKKKKK